MEKTLEHYSPEKNAQAAEGVKIFSVEEPKLEENSEPEKSESETDIQITQT